MHTKDYGAVMILMLTTTFGCNNDSSLADENSINNEVALVTGNLSATECLKRTRSGDSERKTIQLTKEGQDIRIDLNNYYMNCGFRGEKDAKIDCSAAKDTLQIFVEEILPEEWKKDCMCPVNINFTIFGIEKKDYFVKINGLNVGLAPLRNQDSVVLDILPIVASD